MATPKTDGICYICGKKLGKTPMKNHILKEHASDGEEECFLLKIEGAQDKSYWLFTDMAKDKSLGTLDSFMRKIWLECCGHMSVFSSSFEEEIGKTRKINKFSVGDAIRHEYDMGTTTECLVTVAGEILRPKQRIAVRLLARNDPLVFKCASCGKPAEFICQECLYEIDNPNYCESCAEKHEHKRDTCLKITNSPRNGECGYEGEFDTFAYGQRQNPPRRLYYRSAD